MSLVYLWRKICKQIRGKTVSRYLCGFAFKQGAKLQQARLIGASDDVNKRRGALAPVDVGGGFKPTTDGRMESAA